MLLSATVLLGPGAQPAQACSCLASTDEESFARADAVFRGSVVGYQPPPAQPIMSSGDPAIWTFSVTEVLKGDVATTQPVVSAVSGATCGLELPHQGEFFVFASRRDLAGQPSAQYHAHLCGGTRSTAAGPLAVAALRTVPSTTAPPPTTEPPAATTVVVTEPPPVTTTFAPTVVTAPSTTTTPGRKLVAQAAAASESVTKDRSRAPAVGLAVAVGAGALLAVAGVRLRGRRRAAGRRPLPRRSG